MDRNPGHDSGGRTAVLAHAQFVNDKRTIGTFLPAGVVSVRQETSSGILDEVGERLFPPATVGQAVRVRLRNLEDVTGERRQVGFRHDRNERWMEEDLEIVLRNRGEHSVDVNVVEGLYRWRTWGVIRRSHDYVAIGDDKVEFAVTVPSKQQTVVRYTARYTW